MTGPGPDTAPTAPDPAEAPTDARKTLRDQIAEALVEHAHRESRKKEIKPSGFLETVIRTGAESRADAVLPVVEAALAEAEQQGWADADEQIIRPERALHEQTIARAEQAGNRAALYREQVRMEHDRADRAEAAVQRVRDLHTRHDCTDHVKASTPVPCVNRGICMGCGAPTGYPCRTLAALDQEARQ